MRANVRRVALFSVCVVFISFAVGCGAAAPSGSTSATHGISGTVSGAVAYGVTVSLAGPGSRTTTTDPEGRFGFSGLANGDYTITPSLSGYTFTPASKTATVSGASVSDQDFTATANPSPAHGISGTVSGAVAYGVTVSLAGPSSRSTTTDSEGRFGFSGLANGDYSITPSLSGYTFTPASKIATVNGADVSNQDFTAAANTSPAHSISGTVSGAVASGVTVTLAGSSSRSTTTDSAGHFGFSGLANGDYTITPSLSGYTFTPASKSTTVNGADVSNQDFTATANTVSTFSITGTVSGAAGAGVTVSVAGAGTRSTTTNGFGSYVFDGLANGDYSVLPSRAGYTFSPATISVTVNGAHQTGKNFKATANTGPAYSLAGTVSGAVSAGVSVTLAGVSTGTAMTDGSGNYVFTGLANGNESVTPFLSGYTFSPATISVTVSGANDTGNDFVALTAASGAISELPFTSFDPGPWGIAAGPDGNIWVTEYAAEKIARVSLDGTVTEFPLPGGRGMSGYLAGGPDGAVWFTEAGRIGRIAPDGTMTEVMLPNVNDWPRGITTGPDGNLWFVQGSARVDRMTPAGVFTEFAVPNTSALIAIATGPDGNLWFTEHDHSWVGRLTPAGVVTEFSVTGSPESIVAGPDGNLWFAEGDKIGRITPAGSVTEFTLPPNGGWPHGAAGIAAGSDGNLWFTESTPNAVGRITLDGAITEFLIPTGNSGAQAIALGSDGRLWFTEYYVNKVACITP